MREKPESSETKALPLRAAHHLEQYRDAYERLLKRAQNNDEKDAKSRALEIIKKQDGRIYQPDVMEQLEFSEQWPRLKEEENRQKKTMHDEELCLRDLLS